MSVSEKNENILPVERSRISLSIHTSTVVLTIINETLSNPRAKI